MTIGPLMVAVEGTELEAQERELLRHPAVGGVVLFSRNYLDPPQLKRLITAIRSVREAPLLVTVDQEGGRVQRFRTGFTLLPPAATFGSLYDRDPEAGIRSARLGGWLMAVELRACGVDLSFAPVLDLARGVSRVIGDRALHADPQALVPLAQAWCRGMRAAGMAAVGKHFPGHGSTEADSHVALPADLRPLPEIAATDLLPFQRMVALGLPALMAAHVVYPDVDDRPAGFSPRWIGDILRRRIGFQGALFSDDLGMAGAASFGNTAARVHACLAAGCDAALLCRRHLAEEVVEQLPTVASEARSALRLARLFGGPALDWERLKRSAEWRQAVHAIAPLSAQGPS